MNWTRNGRWRRLALGALAFASVLAAASFGPAQDVADRPFDTVERRRLARGQLVTRPVDGPRSMIGGTSFQVVDRPVEEAWSAFVDPRSYRRMLPAAEEARVVGRGADGPILRIRHRVGLLSARYHLRLHFAPATRDVAFELSRSHPNDLQAARGFLQARPYGEDRTLIRWGILADPGGGVFGGLVRGQIHSWMLRVPTTIRAFLHHRRSRQPVAAPQATAG